MVASPLVTRAMQSKNGHVFVRTAFGENPVRSHVDLTRDLFGGCHGTVRGDFLRSMSTMDLLEGVATIEVPTTVMVGTRDALTLPKKADQIVATVPGARLVTLQNRGHMLPLEDPDAVTERSGGRSRGRARGFRRSFPRPAPGRRRRRREHPSVRADEADFGLGVAVHLPTELVHPAVVADQRVRRFDMTGGPLLGGPHDVVDIGDVLAAAPGKRQPLSRRRISILWACWGRAPAASGRGWCRRAPRTTA